MAHPRYLSRHSSRTTTRQPLLARQARQRRGRRRRLYYPGAIRLDTTTKRLIAISPVIHYLLFLLWIIDLFQPAPDIGYAFQPPCRPGCPDAHFYGNSASVINHAKASLIGQIVAHKNGNPSRKGRLLHKGGNRFAFISSLRFDFHNTFTGCNASCGQCCVTCCASANSAASCSGA